MSITYAGCATVALRGISNLSLQQRTRHADCRVSAAQVNVLERIARLVTNTAETTCSLRTAVESAGNVVASGSALTARENG